MHHGAMQVTPTLLTVKAVAEQLGCSETHIYRLIKAGSLRVIDISEPGSSRSKLRITGEEIRRYIDASHI